VVVLSAQGLRRSFGLRQVLDDVSLTIDIGEHVGLVGVNGAGKSTLGRLLAGADTPDGGLVTSRRDASIGYLEQVPQLESERSARDIVLSGLQRWIAAKERYDFVSTELARGVGEMTELLAAQADSALAIERAGGWEMEHEADALLGHLRIEHPERIVGSMSGGEQRRVALARLLVSRPTVAIFDEPTNHLDIDTIEWLEEYLRDRFGGALLLITHDRYLLDRIVDRTCEIEQGKLHAYAGGYADYLEAKAERLAFAERTEANRRNFLRRELEWLRRQPKARTTKSKTRVAKAEAVLSAAPQRAAQAVRLEAETTRTGHTILELKDVSLVVGGRCLVDHLTLALRKGDRIGVIGPNGAGKTSLLRAILNERPVDGGSIVLGKNTAIAYLDQLRRGLDETSSIFDNVAVGRTRIEVGGQALEVRAYLERFNFIGAAQRQPVGSLSGGERARVALAKMLSDPVNLLMLDEPTNDLDVDTLGALEEMIVEFGGTCLVVTHDRYFLDRVATAILAFEGDGKIVRYEGNYSEYLSARPPLTTARPVEVTLARPVKAKPKSAGLTSQEKRELDAMDGRLETADRRVTELESKLTDPSVYSDREEARRVAADLATARVELEALMARWEVLEGKRTEALSS